MKNLIPVLLFLVGQDDAKIAEWIAALPDEKASHQLVSMGDRAVPALLQALEKEPAWNARKTSIEAALWKIRGFRVSRSWVPDLLVDQMRDGHIVARTAEEAAKALRGLDKAFPGLDWEKEMVIVVFPAQKLQSIVVTAVVADAKARTLAVKYEAISEAGCGNTLKCETAQAIAVKRSDFAVTYAPTPKRR